MNTNTPRRRGYSRTVNIKRLHPKVQTLNLLNAIFDRKGSPVPSIENVIPFRYLQYVFTDPAKRPAEILLPKKGPPENLYSKESPKHYFEF